MITMPLAVIDEVPELVEEAFFNGISIFSFSSNDSHFIKKHTNKKVTGFYTDWVLPASLLPASI